MAVTRAFGDPDLTPGSFSAFSKQEISADAAAKAIAQLEQIPPVRSTDPMDLATVIGTPAVEAIRAAGKIVFHTVGDTGGIEHPQFQFAVAEAMADDASSGASFWGCIAQFVGKREDYG